MTTRLVVVCALVAAGCGSSGGSTGSDGGGGTAVTDAATAGSGGSAGSDASAGTGGSSGSGGSADAGTVPGGDDGGASDGGGASGSMASAMITAASGGTLSAGGATLVVPAGVLSADKTLTLTVRAPAADEPGRASIVGDVYEFGPDGTTFAVPVALTLPLSSSLSADTHAVVAWLDIASGQWFPVASTAAADHVTGLVSHFTRFAILQIPKDAICAYGGACGGSLDGTWKYAQSCVKVQESKAFDCGTAGAVNLRQENSIGGTITISQGRFNMDLAIVGNASLFYTPACLAVARQSMPNLDCAMLQEAWRKTNADPSKPPVNWICAGTVDQGCSCQVTSTLSTTLAGTVVVTGDHVSFTADGKPMDPPEEFCVQGNNLSVRNADGEVYTAVRQ